MSEQDRWIMHMLGLASRQKSLFMGTQPVESLIMSGRPQGKMVFLAGDLTEKMMNRLLFLCHKMHIPYHLLRTVDSLSLGQFFGKEKLNAVGVHHQHMVSGIRDRISQFEEDQQQ